MTTAFVMIEIADAMGKSGQRGSFLALLASLKADHNVTILPPTEELYEAGLRLYAKRPDKDWSLTDCVSFVVMDRFGIEDALTGDRHFKQAGFNALWEDRGSPCSGTREDSPYLAARGQSLSGLARTVPIWSREGSPCLVYTRPSWRVDDGRS